ncbi:unnamed protein product, partial [Polarella glacialis]
MFDLTLVDCWANLYRQGDDMKSMHHDNYQDRTPRPTVTIGISLGQARELAFQNASTNREHLVPQENGDVFAFDEPFNNLFKHGVPAARPGTAPGKRISVILWACEQEHVPRALRAKNPGMREVIPLEVDWDAWDGCGFGHLSRGSRRAQHPGTVPWTGDQLNLFLESLSPSTASSAAAPRALQESSGETSRGVQQLSSAALPTLSGGTDGSDYSPAEVQELVRLLGHLANADPAGGPRE